MPIVMPYRTILLNTFGEWIQSKVVWINVLLLWIMSDDFFEAIKLYAVVIGAAYTTIKFYKDFVREHKYWLAFKRFAGLREATDDVAKQMKDADKKDKEK